MELPEEFTGSNDHSPVTKRKRAKRQRPISPPTTAATSSSSTGGDRCGGDSSCKGDFDISNIPSPTTSGDNSTTKEQDEDMANCLILLAQGGQRNSGLFLYDCKTCNRTFPSFQALGGHRASHKKLKLPPPEGIMSLISPKPDHEKEEERKNDTKPARSVVHVEKLSSSSFSKVHGCSICGVEFSSGQALGGHMRRHRPPLIAQLSTVESREEENKPRKFLALDLNLPAPPEDDRYGEPEFQFVGNNERHLEFSGPALVDCYY